jgi:hypothetical protein
MEIHFFNKIKNQYRRNRYNNWYKNAHLKIQYHFKQNDIYQKNITVHHPLQMKQPLFI